MKERVILALIGIFLGWLGATFYTEYEKETRINSMRDQSISNLQAEVTALKWGLQQEVKAIWKELKSK